MFKRLKPLFCLPIFFVLVACQHCHPVNNFVEPNSTWPEVIAYAKNHLPHQGQLVQQSDGYAYIKVDDEYIHKLYPMLKAQGFHKPPYFRKTDAPGAHISLAYEDENVALKEVGQTFSFEITDIALVHPKAGLSFIVLQVSAPDLEQLRQRYGLSPKLKGHEFHITLAKKSS
jgi:hypothetical protein